MFVLLIYPFNFCVDYFLRSHGLELHVIEVDLLHVVFHLHFLIIAGMCKLHLTQLRVNSLVRSQWKSGIFSGEKLRSPRHRVGFWGSESRKNQVFDLFKPFKVTVLHISSQSLGVLVDAPVLGGQVYVMVLVGDLHLSVLEVVLDHLAGLRVI